MPYLETRTITTPATSASPTKAANDTQYDFAAWSECLPVRRPEPDVFNDDGQPRNNTNYGFIRGDWYVWGVCADSPPLPNSPFCANSCVKSRRE